MSIDHDDFGKPFVTSSLREFGTLVAAIVAVILGFISLVTAAVPWAVAHHRLGAVEARVEAINHERAEDKAEDQLRASEISVIKSQLIDIRDQNKRILDKLNQL